MTDIDLSKTFLARAALALANDPTLTPEQAVHAAFWDDQDLCTAIRPHTEYSMCVDPMEPSSPFLAGTSRASPRGKAAIAVMSQMAWERLQR